MTYNFELDLIRLTLQAWNNVTRDKAEAKASEHVQAEFYKGVFE